jgi:hypothetical protein
MLLCEELKVEFVDSVMATIHIPYYFLTAQETRINVFLTFYNFNLKYTATYFIYKHN